MYVNLALGFSHCKLHHKYFTPTLQAKDPSLTVVDLIVCPPWLTVVTVCPSLTVVIVCLSLTLVIVSLIDCYNNVRACFSVVLICFLDSYVRTYVSDILSYNVAHLDVRLCRCFLYYRRGRRI